ncbi:hypothetical protein DFH94DRAFT_691760 [Russula ochroleuca]|uniref:Uncharacterized protein n=1 Tax=Russula ochroleuca TaxID=152965 RepID=A0A9P5MZ85_9AGAM|nr:hypothetical protein DFH94DRAFT_691760 [Russula ochroleuca]
MFFPPLDSTVVVDIPSSAQSGGVSLLFRTRTGSASALEQLKRDGVKVQVWTNAPVDNDRAEVDWAGYNFEEAPAASPVKLDDSVVPFSLPPPTEDNFVDEPHTMFLTLRLRALPHDQTEARFLATYRLLYPNGEIKWLGYQGRDLRCVLRKTDPWLAPPAKADQNSGSAYRTFSSITMKEPWGCWAIGAQSVKYYPKSRATDFEATFLVFIPRRGASTFALHQPIILHGAGLKLDSSGVVTCRTSVSTRVYTAITSEPELSIAIPDLGLHWLGVKEGYAFITSAAPEQPVNIHAVPLFIDPAAADRPTTVSLDLASHGLLANNPRFVIYSPLTNEVLDYDNQGSRQLHLSVGRSGGSCIVSPVYTLCTNKPSPIGKAPWRIAYVTPHTTLGTEPEQEGDSAAEANKFEYDSETDLLSREIKPSPPSRPRMVAAAYLNPRRTIQSLVRLLWHTLGYMVRALVMRLFGMIGLPVSPLVSYLRTAHRKSDHIETQARSRVGESKAGSSGAAKVEYATSEKSAGPSDVLSDSATEVSSVGDAKRRPSRVFNIPGGPFSLLAHTKLTMNVDGDEKTQFPVPDVTLDGERVELNITALGRGWTIMQTKGNVNGGRVEIYDTATST